MKIYFYLDNTRVHIVSHPSIMFSISYEQSSKISKHISTLLNHIAPVGFSPYSDIPEMHFQN